MRQAAAKPSAASAGAGSALDRRPVPVEEAAEALHRPGLVEERQRVQLLQRKAPAQLDQQIDGELVEMFLGLAPRQEAGIGIVAEILQQQEPGGLIRRQDRRHGQARAAQKPRHRQEGPDILRRRRIHEDRGLALPRQPLIAAEGGIARDGPALGRTPAGRGQESFDQQGPRARSRRDLRQQPRPAPAAFETDLARGRPVGEIQRDLQPVRRQQRPQPLRPFDQGDALGEGILDIELDGLLGVLQAVEVEMPDPAMGARRRSAPR